MLAAMPLRYLRPGLPTSSTLTVSQLPCVAKLDQNESAVDLPADLKADLLAELAELVEFPGMLRGEIGASYLDLPEEVLVTTLRHHQKCLVLSRDGTLAPYFLALCDRPDDPEGHVRRGNEWVAGARLADATRLPQRLPDSDFADPETVRQLGFGRELLIGLKPSGFDTRHQDVLELVVEGDRQGSVQG